MYLGLIMIYIGIVLIVCAIVLLLIFVLVFEKNKKKLIRKIYGEIQERK